VTHSAAEDEGPESLPSFSEQVADQLGGVRGMVESSVPVIAFVLVNIIWSLKPALVVAVAVGLAIAGFRLSQRQSVRHAMNGLFGIAIGAFIAWRTGDPQDYYVPGILLSLGYGIAMIVSIAARRPLVGWIWSLVADKGAKRWYEDPGLRRTFNWLTVLWSVTYLAKVVINTLVYFADGLSDDQKATILGIMRIALGFPPYALLAALTVWAVRRYLRTLPDARLADDEVRQWQIKIVTADPELSQPRHRDSSS
jgi:fucose permease